MLILGIDTSCDDTSAAVVANGRKIISNVISSQTEFHKKYGGIVPEVASRKHIELINYVVDDAMKSAAVSFGDLEAIAVTNRPGLIGSLLVGAAVAKSIAYCYDLPLVGINHIEGHLYANFLEHDDIPFPHICLTVSGGHTQLVFVKSHYGKDRYKPIGFTQDDAAGETYDKIAQYLGLGFPGGPIIDKISQKGNKDAVDFPRPMINSGNFNFSFSGLKTAVKYFVMENKKSLPPIEDIAASFQAAVVDVLVAKTIQAVRKFNVKSILLTGGVAANTALRKSMRDVAKEIGIKVYFPSPRLCTDNAAMISGVAYHRLRSGQRDGLGLDASANASLIDNSQSKGNSYGTHSCSCG